MVKNSTNQPVFETGENKDVSLTANPAVTNCSIDELWLSLDPESANIVKQRMLEIERMKEKRKGFLKNHPYQPTHNEKNDRFYTRFLVDGKLVQRNRKSLDEINSLIISYYENGGKLAPEEEPTNVYSFEKALGLYDQKVEGFGLWDQ